ncbi:MAG: F0F1 ATP synthase subunit epsilon [Clostridia bacterium]|nr:MAG: F0F1 ATP synthase subunit epsilon [Clostridia bacterium]
MSQGKGLELKIVTPERVLMQTEAEAVVVPAELGYLGVLPGHAPLLAALKAGVIRYRREGQMRSLAVSGGFMEVASNRVVVLADTAETAEEIDVTRAERARERAVRRLRDRGKELDVARAELALQRALARLKAAGRG